MYFAGGILLPGPDDIVDHEEYLRRLDDLQGEGLVADVGALGEAEAEVERRSRMLRLEQQIANMREQFDTGGQLSVLASIINKTARYNGFWEYFPELAADSGGRGTDNELARFYVRLYLATKIALIHSEGSEALKELRTIEDQDAALAAMARELADTVVRCLDLMRMCTDDTGGIILEVISSNTRRPYKHGRFF